MPGEQPKTVTVDESGNWTVDVGDAKLQPGDEVTAVQADGDNVSDPTTQIVQERTAPPVINGIIEGATTITGTGKPGATVTVTLPNGEKSKPVTVDENGNWTVDVSGADLKAGDKVTAVQADGDNVSEETSQTVKERTAPPSVYPIAEGSSTIVGSGIPGATITVTGPNGDPIGEPVTVGEDGSWVFDASGADLKAGEEVSVVQTVDDNASEPVKVTVGS